MPESGEEASALCSYVFEGHYTDEATEPLIVEDGDVGFTEWEVG